MFGTFDHLSGAFRVRLRRYVLNLRGKPDISFINPNLGVGGVSSVKSLQKCGIQAVLDLRLEDKDDPKEIQKHSMEYMSIEIPDRGTPDFEYAIRATIWMKSNIDQGKKVFVHCNLGRGRGPLLTVTYLVSQGVKCDEAIKIVKTIRPYSFFNKKQLQWIHEFENWKD
jgi:protein-tyrosine phosphatase